jgi:hypothetical protein
MQSLPPNVLEAHQYETSNASSASVGAEPGINGTSPTEAADKKLDPIKIKFLPKSLEEKTPPVSSQVVPSHIDEEDEEEEELNFLGNKVVRQLSEEEKIAQEAREMQARLVFIPLPYCDFFKKMNYASSYSGHGGGSQFEGCPLPSSRLHRLLPHIARLKAPVYLRRRNLKTDHVL